MLLSKVTLTVCPGSSVLSWRRMASMLLLDADALALTFTLKNCRPPRVSQIIRLVSPAVFPLTMISVRLMAWVSAISPRPTAMRLMGLAVSTSTVLPTAT